MRHAKDNPVRRRLQRVRRVPRVAGQSDITALVLSRGCHRLSPASSRAGIHARQQSCASRALLSLRRFSRLGASVGGHVFHGGHILVSGLVSTGRGGRFTVHDGRFASLQRHDASATRHDSQRPIAVALASVRFTARPVAVSGFRATSELATDIADMSTRRPNHALQRTRPSRYCSNRGVSWAGSLSLGRSAKADALRASTNRGRRIRSQCISAWVVRSWFYLHQSAFRCACSSTPFGGCRHSRRCAGCLCFRTLDNGNQQWATSMAGRCRLRQSIRTTRKESPNQSVEPTALPLELGVYS
jgi:hypothetical protein